MKLRTLLFVGFATILSAVVARSLWVTHAFKQILTDYTHLVQQHDRALAAADRVAKVSLDLETGIRGWTITRDVAFLDPYDHASSERPVALGELAALVRDEPTQSALVERLENELDEWDRAIAQ